MKIQRRENQWLYRNLCLGFSMTLVLSLQFSVRCSPLVDRSVSFNDFRAAQKLVGHVIGVKAVIIRRKCAMLCLQTPACMSFNYFKSRNCHLNSRDVLTPGTEMVQDPHSIYQGMRMNEIPKCLEKGNAKGIQYDGSPNFCKINQKRQDSKWSQWEEQIEIDNAEEWRKVSSRFCHEASHGGILNCDGEPERKVLEWLHFVQERAFTFEGAFDFCNQSGWDVFYRLNGTREQLNFIHKKLQKPECFWIGAERVGRKWTSWSGSEIEEQSIVWSTGEPNNIRDETFLIGLQTAQMGFDNIHNMNPVTSAWQCKVVCDEL